MLQYEAISGLDQFLRSGGQVKQSSAKTPGTASLPANSLPREQAIMHEIVTIGESNPRRQQLLDTL